MEVNGAPKQPGYKLSSKYIPLCSAEQRNSYRFGTTLGRVNDGINLFFGWTILGQNTAIQQIYTQCTFRYLYSGTFPVLFNVLCLQENTFHIYCTRLVCEKKILKQVRKHLSSTETKISQAYLNRLLYRQKKKKRKLLETWSNTTKSHFTLYNKTSPVSIATKGNISYLVWLSCLTESLSLSSSCILLILIHIQSL